MTFGDSINFVFLWLAIIMAILIFLEYKIRARRLKKIAPYSSLKTLVGRWEQKNILLKNIFFILGLLLLVVALAKPRIGFTWRTVEREGSDIMLVVDVSQSMSAEDIKPSRLERSRREILDLLGLLQGDRIGIVSFAGVSFMQSPLTMDYGTSRLFLESLEPGMIPVPGTNIADALAQAIQSLEKYSSLETEGKSIILFTDGEDHSEEALEVAKEAADKGIKVFVVGIGSAEGAPIPLKGGGYKKDSAGNVVISKLGETSLKKLALTTGGIYVRSVSGDMDLDTIYSKGIQKLSKQSLGSSKEKIWNEIFQWFLFFAIVLLLVSFLISDFRRNSVLKIAISFFIGTSCLLSSNIKAEDLEKKAHELYEEKKYKESAEKFLEHEVENPKDLENIYNRGVAQYRAGNFKEAAEAFAHSRSSEDKNLSKNSLFNLGNSLVQNQKYKEGIETYEELLKKHPENESAKYNLELAKKLLELQKKQQQEKQKEGKKDSEEQKQQDSEEQKQQDSEEQKQQDSEEQKQQDSEEQKQQDSEEQKQQEKKEKGKEEIIMDKGQAERYLESVDEKRPPIQYLRNKAQKEYKNSEKDW